MSPDGTDAAWVPSAQGAYHAERWTQDKLAVGSLVASLVWLVGLGSVAAVVMGHLSRTKAQARGRRPAGLALAGVVLGYAGLFVTAVALLALLSVPALHSSPAKAEEATTKNALRDVALSEETYFTGSDRYTTNTDDLPGLPLAVAGSVEIVSADDASFCLKAVTQHGATWFFASASGFSAEPCRAPAPRHTFAAPTLQDTLSAAFPMDEVRAGDCDDESLDVAGTHAPQGCTAGLYVYSTAPDGATGTIGADKQLWVDTYASAHEAEYQERVQVRYWRQYAGRKLDTVIAGLPNSHLFITNHGMNCMAMFRSGTTLVLSGCHTDFGHTVPKAMVSRTVELAKRVNGLLPR